VNDGRDNFDFAVFVAKRRFPTCAFTEYLSRFGMSNVRNLGLQWHPTKRDIEPVWWLLRV
jgi:hypothetical protein